MLLTAIKRFSLIALMCSCASAAPVYLGGISFHLPGGGDNTGNSNEFRLFNWTGGAGGATYGLSTSVTFAELSLRIDYVQGGNTVQDEEAWLPAMVVQPTPQFGPVDLTSATPHAGLYRLFVDITKNITRAVFTAKLSNTGPWTLQAGGTATPSDPALDPAGYFRLEMLPSTGPYFTPESDDFPISISSVPEPMTVALTGLGLVGIIFVRRRRA